MEACHVGQETKLISTGADVKIKPGQETCFRALQLEEGQLLTSTVVVGATNCSEPDSV